MDRNDVSGPAFLLHKTVFLLSKIAGRLLHDRVGITFPQFLLLVCIARHPEAAQRDIARFRDMTEAAISRHMAELVQRGLLTRRKSRSRRRAQLLALTPAGTRLLRGCTTLLQNEFSKLFRVLPTAQERAITHALHQLHEAAYRKASALGCVLPACRAAKQG